MVAHGADAGIRWGGTVPEDMVAQRLSADVRWIVVGAPAYLDRHGTPTHPRDLADHHCLRLRLGDESIYHWEFEKDGDEIAIDVPGAITLNETQFAITLAAAGTALAYLPEPSVTPLVEAGALRMILADWGIARAGLPYLLSGSSAVTYRAAPPDRPHSRVASARLVESGIIELRSTLLRGIRGYGKGEKYKPGSPSEQPQQPHLPRNAGGIRRQLPLLHRDGGAGAGRLGSDARGLHAGGRGNALSPLPDDPRVRLIPPRATAKSAGRPTTSFERRASVLVGGGRVPWPLRPPAITRCSAKDHPGLRRCRAYACPPSSTW